MIVLGSERLRGYLDRLADEASGRQVRAFVAELETGTFEDESAMAVRFIRVRAAGSGRVTFAPRPDHVIAVRADCRNGIAIIRFAGTLAGFRELGEAAWRAAP